MNLSAEISQLNLDPVLIEQLLSTIQQAHLAADKSAQLERKLKSAELKIQALTLELAHHKRIRFGVKNEALSPEQRELFTEDWSSDNAALELAVAAVFRAE